MKVRNLFKAALGIGTAIAAGYAVKKVLDTKKEQEEIKRFINLDEVTDPEIDTALVTDAEFTEGSEPADTEE